MGVCALWLLHTLRDATTALPLPPVSTLHLLLSDGGAVYRTDGCGMIWAVISRDEQVSSAGHTYTHTHIQIEDEKIMPSFFTGHEDLSVMLQKL